VDEIADAMAESLGWSGERKTAEVEKTLRLLADRHNVNL
jgi:hypothetical protein